MGYNLEKQNRTKETITKSFIDLYQRNEYKKITVAEICLKAGVHRSTFYLYYGNTDLLLREVEDRLLEELQQFNHTLRLFDFRKTNHDGFALKSLMPLVHFFLENRKTFVVFMSPQGDPCFHRKLKRWLWDAIVWSLHRGGFSLGAYQEYVLEGLVSNVFTLLYLGLEKQELKTEEIANLIMKTVFGSPFLRVGKKMD